MSIPLQITGTKSWTASSIRHTIFGWRGKVIALVVLGAAALVLLATDDAAPLLVCVLSILFAIQAVSRFLKEKIEDEASPLPAGAPAADCLSANIIRSVAGLQEIQGTQLIHAALDSDRGKFLTGEMALTSEAILKECAQEIEAMDVPSFVTGAFERVAALGETRVDANAILAQLFLTTAPGKKLVQQADLSEDDFKGLLHWESFKHRFSLAESPWSADALRRNASLGRSWVMGYTNALDALTSEVDTAQHTSGEKSVIIHNDIIARSMQVLARKEHRNILLLGQIGTGRKTLVRNIAAALRTFEREKNLPFTRVLTLHTEKLLSGTGNPDAFLLKAIRRAQEGGSFVLVIPDFPSLLKSADSNLRTVLMRCLESTAFSIVGIAASQDYHSLIKADVSIDTQFEKIDVEDATDEETMQVLMAHYFVAGNRNVQLTYKGMRSIIDLSKRYLATNVGMPGKALSVMDDAIRLAASKGEKYLTEAQVREIVSVRGKVNVQKVNDEEKTRLLNLESILSEHVIGQPDAIRAVSAALKRARLDLSDRKRPIGTFLFLGPTGVGKTETAKTLAREYFGSVDAMIRLDMNEYSHADSVFNITGSSSGGEGFLAQRVQDRPFSLILLDEIEKADKNVLNLFLQVLDEGFLTDSRGVRTDFRNTIIIATSNAGALFIRDYVRDNETINGNVFRKKLIDTILQDRLFAPEFMNRFDEIVLFYPLSQKNAEQVAILMLDDIITDVKRKRGIDITMEADVVGGLVERGYSVEFGARELRRTITDMIEDYIANYMLSHDVKRGDTIVIRKEDLKW